MNEKHHGINILLQIRRLKVRHKIYIALAICFILFLFSKVWMKEDSPEIILAGHGDNEHSSDRKGLATRTPIGRARDFTRSRSKIIQYDKVDKKKFKEEKDRIDYGKGENTKLLKSEDISYFDCDEYFQEIPVKRTVIYNILSGQHDSEDDVCFITQLDEERIDPFIKQLHVWEGPVSASVLVQENTINQFMNKLKGSSILLKRSNVKLHLVLRKGIFYPVNTLRNIAISQAKTNYIFTTDVDFMMSKDLHYNIAKYVKGHSSQNKKAAFIIPAFDLMDNSFNVPASKEDLRRSWEREEAVQFHHYFKRGHAATDYQRWFSSHAPYMIEDVPKGYEPYMVLPKKDIPIYDERFLEYYMNKIQFMDELLAMKFTFEVLPDGFVIHLPHRNRQTYYQTVAVKRCVQAVYNDFTEEIKVKYGSE